MKIAILHNAASDSDSIADQDVMVQAAAVEQALRSLGHEPVRLACTLNLESVEEAFLNNRPDLVFNLVETLGGSDRLAHLAGLLLEDLDLPYTGTPASAFRVTCDKPVTKTRLRSAGLPTPDWVTAKDCESATLAPPYIIKAVWEHASVGLDDHAVIQSGDGSTVMAQIESRSRQLGRACFAERFIPGREFNLSLIAAGDGPQVLPPAEIDFSAFPPDKPKIVGYAAKWETGAFEYFNTPRTFEFAPSDAPLLDWLRALAVDCWRLLDLHGYARVDFRVAEDGQPWILEINSNPCLSPDAGFAAALVQLNLPFEKAVERIIDDALRKKVESRDTGIVSRAIVGHETIIAGQVLSTQYSVLSTPADSRVETSHDSVPARTSKKSKRQSTKLRTAVQPTDRDAVRRIVESTNLFRPAELDVAVELVDARLAKGPDSGYEFAFAEQKGQVVGYVCFGKNTLTVSSYDVYWIAVDPNKHGQGIGRLLLDEAERSIADVGGTRIYIETSHRPDYQATRGFYERCGYRLESILEEYYAPGDSKAIYVKRISTPDPPPVPSGFPPAKT